MKPDVDDLLAAVRWTIEEALLPEVTGPYARFQALIAIDLLDLIGRHWAQSTQDAVAAVRDYGAALEKCQPFLEKVATRDLSARIDEALHDTLPEIPPAWADLVVRVAQLSSLADEILDRLPDSDDAGAEVVRAHLRTAARSQLDRLSQRHAGLDIRR